MARREFVSISHTRPGLSVGFTGLYPRGDATMRGVAETLNVSPGFIRDVVGWSHTSQAYVGGAGIQYSQNAIYPGSDRGWATYLSTWCSPVQVSGRP